MKDLSSSGSWSGQEDIVTNTVQVLEKTTSQGTTRYFIMLGVRCLAIRGSKAEAEAVAKEVSRVMGSYPDSIVSFR